MSFATSLTSSIANAAVDAARWFNASELNCSQTLNMYNEEISWVQGSITVEVEVNNALLSNIWDTENRLQAAIRAQNNSAPA